MQELAARTRRPVTFACLQNDLDPEQWRRSLRATERAAAAGAPVVAQVAVRPTGLLMGLESTTHPFFFHQAYREIAHLPLAERVARMRQPEVRRRMLEEKLALQNPMLAFVMQSFHKLFPLGDPPDYEPGPEQSVKAIAEREGRPAQEVAYDLLLRRDGRELLYFPILGYAHGNFDAIREMLLHPNAVLSLSDGGAHCGLICDASAPSYLLTHWVRDRKRGERLPLEWAVRAQTRNTARLYGFEDRGALEPGLRADVNLIDFDGLRLSAPEMVYDLPAGGRRLIQRASGYQATLVAGEVVQQDGQPTGAMPGRLVRGPQVAAA
jgi:N-acyl-D-aspartate/D-glutamate deacylase